MEDCCYKPNGELQGDTKPMPNRHSRTGLNGDTYGADISPDATNSTGGLRGATKSDRAERDMPPGDR